MSEENKRIVRGYFEELDRGRTTPVHLCTADYRFHPAGLPSMDLDGVKAFGDGFFVGMPDLRHPLEELIAEGDLVALRCRYEGTHNGELMGVAPTGRRVSAIGIGVMRIADGKIAEFWVSPDRMTIMQQIGALPSQA
ncbi:ester cyclase [Micromonospora sp. NPDC049523]|uniref:ester cyclase n=1 Tax=Micromonospora sp. NPDC049523 TaxID=3155921 RepID=UPI00341AB828